MTESPLIRLSEVGKQFLRQGRALTACHNVSLSVARGEFVAIVGPSGCGKSTLLNMIAGLMRPSAGRILYDQAPVRDINRRVGYVTQRDNLLPWASVESNVGLALEIQKVPAAERHHRVRQQLEMVGLLDFKNHFPAELSGGMRKRVGLARTLIYNPETILMDEPFAALDAQLRLILQDQLLKLWQGTNKTVVFVTHDLSEAVTLADRVAVMSSRPGTVKLNQIVDLPRPRDVFAVRFSPRFGELHQQLWDALEQDIYRSEEL